MKNNIYRMLFEQEEAGNKVNDNTPEADLFIVKGLNPSARKSNVSVDEQIDSLILLYENKSIKSDEDLLMELLSNKKLSLKFLFEQDEDAPAEEPTDEPAEEPADTTASDDPSDAGSAQSSSPAKGDIVPDLDVSKFASKVARLIMNYKNLLRIEDVILNRGKSFLDENYGDAFVAKYLEVLERDYGVVASEFGNEKDVEDAPFAIGANPAGAGMSGGS
jgi:hypothetical protein